MGLSRRGAVIGVAAIVVLVAVGWSYSWWNGRAVPQDGPSPVSEPQCDPEPGGTPVPLDPDSVKTPPRPNPEPDRIGGYVGSGLGGACAWTMTSVPMEGVSVALVYAGSEGSFGDATDVVSTTVTDKGGCFSFEAAEDGSYRLSVPPDHATQAYHCDSDGSDDATIEVFLSDVAASSFDNHFGYMP